jgi:hypothetical protein
LKAFEVAMENGPELLHREFKGESLNGRPPGEMAIGFDQKDFGGLPAKVD